MASESSGTKKRASIISHTHWDREWYLPFQGFRMRLVGLIDEMLDVMERDPRYRYFHMDGQAIVLEDYLEIRPENRGRLERVIRDGRVLIGPWYVQPDESLPSGEAHIRNLLLGHRVAREFGGEALKSGYVVDVFGHISQFPQILAGFGIDNAVLFRGMNDDQCGAECWWVGADGTKTLVLRLSNDIAYSDFWYEVRKAFMGREMDIDEALGLTRTFLDWFMPRFSTDEILLMDGVDHVEVEPELGELIDQWNATHHDVELVQESLATYLDRLRPKLGPLPSFHGELRRPNRQGRLSNLFAGIHSSRAPLKQQNEACESLLTLWAEPSCAAAWLAGDPYPARYLDLAWRHLLHNQPHDSICGCSVDQVHKDMLYRYDQCRLIGEGLVDGALRSLAQRIDAKGPQGATHVVTVFSSAGSPERGAQVLTIDIPHPRPAWFRLADAEGHEVPYQILDEKRGVPRPRVGVREIPQFPAHDVLTIAAAPSVPAFGAQNLFLVPSDSPVRYRGSLCAAPRTLENDDVRVEAASDGLLSLLDKATGHEYHGLMVFEDGADVGDGWTFRPAPHDEVVLSSGSPATISLVQDGPLAATLRVETSLWVPESIAPGGASRSADRVAMRIVSFVTLLADTRAVQIRTSVENVARDHRLRVLFPTGLTAQDWFADMQFDVVRRPIALLDTRDWVEEDSELKPQQSFAAVCDGQAGLAVVAPRQKEAAVRDDAARTLALTLFRGFRATVGTAGEDGGQCLGTLDFEYAVVPFSFRPRAAGLPAFAQRMRSGFRCVTSPPHEGTLQADAPLVEVEPAEVQVTAVKRHESEDALVVRLWNPAAHDVTAVVTPGFPVADAWLTDLQEADRRPTGSPLGDLRVAVGPNKLVSLVLVPAR